MKSIPKKTAQAIKKVAKEETGNFARSAVEQLFPSSKDRISPIVEAMQQKSDGSYDTEAIKRNERQRLSQLVRMLEEEQGRIRAKKEQEYGQRVSAKTEEKRPTHSPVEPPKGKIRRIMGGAKKRLSQVTNKSEVGRGAKN